MEQTTLTDEITKSVFVDKRNVFLSGPGGCGKSYILTNIIKPLAQQKGLNIHITSTTGISAFSIGGTTIHRWSGIKLGKENIYTIVNRILSSKEQTKQWKNADILVIDEISMLGKKMLEVIDRVGREIRDNEYLPFGGLQVIFSGDFLQLPPVQDEFCFKSPIWDELNLRYFKLTEPKRYPDKDHFFMLQRIRLGQPSQEDIKKLKQRVSAYVDYIGKGSERSDIIKPTRLVSLKKDVEKYNLIELDKLEGEEVCFEATDRIILKNNKDSKKQLSEKEKKECSDFLDTVIPYRLHFKPGAQVMLTYNLDVDTGLVNGSRGVVVSIVDTNVNVKFRNGQVVPITYNMYEMDDVKMKMIRYQIPLTLSWACSIHKSQGSTLDYAIMDLGTSIFSPGMAYVALSRVKTLEGLFLSSFFPKKIYSDTESLQFEQQIDTQQKEENEELSDIDTFSENTSSNDSE